MTPTTSEREARELLAREYERDGQDFVARCLRYEPDVTTLERRSIRAIIAALTREQREGDGIEGWQRALVDSVHRWREHPQQEAQGAVAGWSEAEQRATLVNSLRASKSWMTGYAEAFVDAFQDHARTTPPAPVDVQDPRFEAGFKEGIKFCETHFHNAPVDVRVRAIVERMENVGRTRPAQVGGFDTVEGWIMRWAAELRAILDGQPAGVES